MVVYHLTYNSMVTHNRRFTKACMESIIRWHFLLWWSRMPVILHHSNKCTLILDIGFSCIVCSPFFTVLYGCTSFHHVAWTLSLSEILSESALMFSVGLTKLECWMYIMLVRCDVLLPVKLLRKSLLSTIWMPFWPIPSSGGKIDAFSRSQRTHLSQRWRISA